MKRTFLTLALLFAAVSFAFAAPPVTIGVSGDLLLTHPYTPGQDVYTENPAKEWTVDVAMRLFEYHGLGVMIAGGITQTRRSFEPNDGWYTWGSWFPLEDIKWDENRFRLGLRGRYELWKGSISAGGGIMQSDREYIASNFPLFDYSRVNAHKATAPYVELGISFKVWRHLELFARHEWFFSGPLEFHEITWRSFDNGYIPAGTVPVTSNASEVLSLNLGIRILLP